MFQIKVCGVTAPEQIAMLADAGVDAVGINFYPASKRFVEQGMAAQIVATVPAEMVKVGLFVNKPADEVIDIFSSLRLDLIQLHGDETPEYIAALGGRPVLRAFRFGAEGIAPIARYLAECRVLECLPNMVLLDADAGGAFGGSGHVADWQRIAVERRELGELPIVLAGGLDAGNVAEAIRVVEPLAVDTASGVESAPGEKDAKKVKAFSEAARPALDQPA